MSKRLAATILGVVTAMVCCAPARAQRGGGLVFAPIRRSFPSGLHGPVATNPGRSHRAHRSMVSGFAPYFYSDYEPDTVEGRPREVVTAPEIVAPVPAVKPAESVLLELRGDRWVRITNYGASDSDAGLASSRTGGTSTLAPVTSRSDGSQATSAALPRAALVFRDGHTEEIPKYVIVGRTLYTTADYWSTGSWTRRVEIAQLDVPATLKLNRERGTKFSLPSGPTEVMIRP